jgi:hypothetical protein
MRTSRLATLSTAVLLGLGTVISQANPAAAAPPKGPHGLEIAPTTTTTKPDFGIVPKPHVDPPVDDDLPIAQPQPTACDPKVVICDIAIPDPVDPPADPGLPLAIPDPGPSCNPHQAHCGDVGIPDDPECDPQLATCDIALPDPGDHGSDHGADQGSDGGGDRLPHTGLDLAEYLAVAFGLLGAGAALRRLSRRA